MWLMQHAQQIMNKTRYEYRLAGAAQTRNRETDGRALREIRQVGHIWEPLGNACAQMIE
jgi:hypothetical protein